MSKEETSVENFSSNIESHINEKSVYLVAPLIFFSNNN